MQIASDYKDLLKILNKHKVKYLIVGAYAVIYYTEPRYTKDIDIWIEPTIGNAKKAYESLREFGAPLKNISQKDFANKNLIYQIGLEPVRIDIIMSIPGLGFNKAWQHKSKTKIEGIGVNIIGVKELIASKKKTKRPLDLADAQNLLQSIKLKKRK
jgi:predicted nucleotidyltransferase